MRTTLCIDIGHDASANSWKLGGAQTSRQILDWPSTIQKLMQQVEEPSHVVVFTDSDHAGCLKTRHSTSSSKLFDGSHMLLSTSTARGVLALSLGESEFYALLKGTSAGFGAVSMLKDLRVYISNNTQIDKAVLEVRIDGPPDEAWQYGEEPTVFGTLLLQHCGCQTAKSKSRQSVESRT